MNLPTDWLLSGPPWTEYRTRIDLLAQSEKEPEVIKARSAMLDDARLKSLIGEFADWEKAVLKTHKSAGHLLHKLVFLADLGFQREDPGISEIVGRIRRHRSPEGIFRIVMNLNPRYGGSGKNQFVWMLCDAPLILYALGRFGLKDTREVRQGVEYLKGLAFEKGWKCIVSAELGKFRGPGRKTDPCPYATLVMLRLLKEYPEYYSSDCVQNGMETLLSLWEKRKEQRPYMFAMGSDFVKLKAPLIWYDVLHLTDVLSHFPQARKDKRLREIVNLIKGKMGEDTVFGAESVWRAWKEWEFGQKREPSRWITFLAHRLFKRMEL